MRLSPVAAALPALAGSGRLSLFGQACADRRVAGEELVEPAEYFLPRPLEVPMLGLDVSTGPLPDALGPGLRSLSGGIGETCLSQAARPTFAGS